MYNIKKTFTTVALLFVATMLFSVGLFAQTLSFKGIVKDKDGLPLPGAIIYVPGTSVGAQSDEEGKFSLNVKPNTEVIISLLGYEQQSIKIGNSNVVKDIVLGNVESINEVVVTALGVAREKKTLGYAIQEIKSGELLSANELNITNALTGKVAGLQIIRSSNGPGSSSKIVLRGNSSLTGLNQPLLVVDGVPMDNFIGAANNDFWNPTADQGNGLQDINQEDVESMTVLKGASAAALYGSRAGNGVILITTKKGGGRAGLGITVSSSLTATSIFARPKMQKTYGQGTLGNYDVKSGVSWGPEIKGQEYLKWNDEKGKMTAYDNVNGFFGTGLNATENISFSQRYSNGSLYASITRMDDKSMIPEAGINRTNMMLRGVTDFGKDKRWTFDAKVQYVRSNAKNRPISGANPSNSFIQMYTLPISLDVTEFSKAVDEKRNMFWFNDLSAMNPYWIAKYKTNQDMRNRFLMSASLKYRFTDWLDLELRGGTDMYNTETENKVYGGNTNLAGGKGSYAVSHSRFYENNLSFLFTAKKENIFGEWGGALTFGGNMMERESKGLSSSMPELNIRDYFSLNNAPSGKHPSVSESYSHRMMNSLYGTGQINYGGFIYLDATWRNDWTSTLSKANRSFFYPSLSLSYVISEMVNKYWEMPSWFSYAKLRASYAMVGNDLDPYQLYNEYTIGSSPEPLKTPMASFTSNVLYNSNVKNELIKSWELGADIRFFDNRLGFDFAWYKSNATNQLINLPMNKLSGYTARKVNAGNIQNSGFELIITSVPVRTRNFEWGSNLNISHNSNKIIDLADGVSEYSLGSFDNFKIVAKVGGEYGEIYGTKYARVEDKDSPYYGKMILNSDGLPTSARDKYLGSQNSKLLLGWTNSFTFKNFSMSFQIDARLGGKIFSGTLMSMQYAGTAWETAAKGRVNDLVLDGVIKKDDGTYEVNTKKTTTEKYWQQISGKAGGNLGITEANLYDATNIRLRNLSLAYSLPKKVCNRIGFIQSAKIGVSVNNVLMLYSKMKGLDPESVYATSTNATGFEYGSTPTARSFIFNITLGF